MARTTKRPNDFEKFQEKLEGQLDKFLNKANAGEGRLVFFNGENDLYFTEDGFTAYLLYHSTMASAVWDKIPPLSKENKDKPGLYTYDKLPKWFEPEDHLLAMEITNGTMNGYNVVRLSGFEHTAYIKPKYLKCFPKNSLFYVDNANKPIIVALPAMDGSFKTVGVIMTIIPKTAFAPTD